MSKITIVSRPDQHLLIDISGCLTFKEAIEQLSTALLSANQFWQGTSVDLRLGGLLLTKPQLGQIIALTKGVGINAHRVLADNPHTAAALNELETMLAASAAANEETPEVSSVSVLPEQSETIAATAAEEFKEVVESAEITSEPIQPEQREMVTSTFPIPEEHSNASGNKTQSLYIKQTLRAGQAVSHKGDLIIIGDVNAGAEVLAFGDITVWGSLRGIAHAGVGGNTNAEIRALRLQPIQVRIAHYIARSPDALLTGNSIVTASPFMAETAKLIDGKIRILRETFD